MEFNGLVTITRTYGGVDDDHPVHIRVIDDDTGQSIVDVNLSLEDFASAIFGRGRVPAKCRLGRADLVGKTQECKTEVINIRWGAAKDEAVEILKPYEVDGWEADVSSALNPHNWAGKDHVRVNFTRYVDRPIDDRTSVRDITEA